MDDQKKQLLLCVAGLTPPIIMETLYALTQLHGERISEVLVVTTLAGQDKVTKELLEPTTGRFHQFCRDYPSIEPIKFDETSIITLRSRDGRPLKDIRSLEDNSAAADQIFRLVQELVKNEPQTRIHASTAGGRKTMGFYLTAAMQVLGRSGDSASHTLVNEDFEFCKDFYYPPPVPCELELRDREGNTRRISTADAKIDLAFIPFIKLRRRLFGWLEEEDEDKDYDYEELVSRGQIEIDFLDRASDVRLDARSKTVSVGGREVELTEREFYVYVLFAYLSRKRRGAEGFVSIEEITREDLDVVCRIISSARGRQLDFEGYANQPRCGYLSKLDLSSVVQKQVREAKALNMNRQRRGLPPLREPEDRKAMALEEVKEVFEQIFSKINRKLEDKELLEKHLITSRGPRRALRYGLELPPDRIKLP